MPFGNSKIVYFSEVLGSIHKFIIKLHTLPCLFVRGSNKQQRRGGITSNITKEQTFSSFMTTKCSWGVISQCSPPYCSPQKRPSSPLQFDQEDNIPGYLSERRAYCFVLKKVRRQRRNKMMNTFLIVSITPTCNR